MSAKDLRIHPISSADARRVTRALHYSGKVVPNSQLHLGVFYRGRCGGVLSFGPSIDKRRMAGLVTGSKLNEFIELNRMCLADWLPRNGESRSLAVAMRILRKRHPILKWVVSFADGCQCGDGTIYRASGFVLTGIKRNTSLLRAPDGSVVAKKTLDNTRTSDGRYMSSRAAASGFQPLEGFQLRYVYFLDPSWRQRLSVEEIPFSAIDDLGAGMYRGEKRRGKHRGDATPIQGGEGGSSPTSALHPNGGDEGGDS